MTAAPTKRIRPLATLHLLAVLTVGLWWTIYFWQHTPARGASTARSAASTRAVKEVPDAIDLPLDGVERALRLAAGDIAFGAIALVLLGVGTGAYVRRVEIWLEARTSGQAVAFGADGLEGKALLANSESRRKGP
jgi:hypothetical protein